MARRDDEDDSYSDILLGRYRNQGKAPASHSGLGMTSLVISILAGLGAFVCIFIAALISLAQNGQVNDNDPIVVVVGLGIIGSGGMALVGGVLGLVALFQRERNPVCAILGGIFNAAVVLGIMFLMCLGLVMPK